MLKVKDDVNLKELEQFGFMKWDKENALVCYFKFIPINSMIVQILNDRTINFQLPINSMLKEKDINLETFIKDLIQAGLVEKVEE